ncbi:MAG: phosphoenolpyruvate synthase, partial [Dehalococcoidia bacterium]|nr:phosphoenolpyruvate synthase [Dehalococcoidia bacterium]
MARNIVWFQEVGKGDIPLVGGKGANLGEMTNSGIPVPPGFIVTSDAYAVFLEESGLVNKISAFLDSLDTNDFNRLDEVATRIRQLMNSAPMPQGIADEIVEAYHKMGDGMVAARSSATAEDLPEASFAGQQRTFLNIKGDEELLWAIQGCWASLFETRAIFYRVEQGFDHLKVRLAVPVQRMIQSEVAGVMFTAEPVSSDKSKVVIEAAYGLGESVVSGDVTPDFYVLDKSSMKISDKKIARQPWSLVRNTQSKNRDDSNIKVPIPSEEQSKQKLSDVAIVKLAEIAKRIEKHYGFPQDIEWAYEDGEFYIVQTRPITTISDSTQSVGDEIEAEVILSGLAASPGMVSGLAKIVHDPSKVDIVKEGDILVAEATTPDFVPAMKRAAAIITDYGGRTCHAAIVSRELGVPCVVGTQTATQELAEGRLITVNGSRGEVYDGKIEQDEEAGGEVERAETRTNVYVNLFDPDLADRTAARYVDGVGLLRAEFIVAGIGKHPRYMLDEGKGDEFIDNIVQGLTKFAKVFNPRPVVYRATDFKTNEYRNLKGGEKYETVEENPMMGYRGCARYIGDPEVFKMEIEAIKRVRETYKNLWVMIPFVRTVDELSQVKTLMENEGLVRSADFKLWIMVEVPSNVILLDKFIDVGIDGVSIGSNDLTQLTLGLDRDN